MVPHSPCRIAPRVYVVGGPEITDPADGLVYAVDGNTEIALVDSGAGASVPRILENLRLVGLDPERIGLVVLTHRHVDHVGGAPALAGRFSPRIACHHLDAGALEAADPASTAASWYGVHLPPIRVDERLEGREGSLLVGDLTLGWIHTPGHTPGSIALYLDTEEGRVVFAHDVHGPFMSQFGSDIDRWAESMERLLALEPDILCEGHFGIFRPRKVVERFVREHLRAQGYGA